MGAASRRLRGDCRRRNAAGLLALLALVAAGPLPAAAGDEGKGRGNDNGSAHGNGHSGGGGKPAAPGSGAAPAPPAHGRSGGKQAGPPPGAPKKAPEPAPQAAAPVSPGDAGASGTRGHRGRSKVRDRKLNPAAVPQPAPASAPVAAPVAAPVTAPAATAPAAAPAPARRAIGRRTAPALREQRAARQRAARQRAARQRAARQRTARQRRAGRSAGRPPRQPPLGTDRWVPADSAVAPAVAASAPAPDTPGSAAEQGGRGTQRDDADSSGPLAVFPVVVDALSESVAFVPEAVWFALGALALLALLLLAVALGRDRRARALAREREVLLGDLEALQGAVVPALPEALGGLAISVTSTPAARPVDGEDFHDAFPLSPDRVGVLIGDVAGHGRQAVADAQLVRHAVRAYLEAGLDPRAALAMTGAIVDEREESLFASVLVAVHDRRDGTLTFASAGHEPPILVAEHRAALPPVSGWSPPLGTGLETGRRQTAIPLHEGTAVCLMTDGVTEARSDGERLGASRIMKWLAALGPGAMSSDVVTRLRAEADTGDEDTTVCMLRALTPAAPDAPRIEEAVVEGGDPTYLVRFLRDCGLPLADAQEAGEALAAAPDGTRMIASVEIRGGRAVVELAPLRTAGATELVG